MIVTTTTVRSPSKADRTTEVPHSGQTGHAGMSGRDGHLVNHARPRDKDAWTTGSILEPGKLEHTNKFVNRFLHVFSKNNV